ncbi:hypothetical protein CEX98_21905 [Pseudoalteromonas piscicida]|uniref:Uncharacterized protein n=1 Tax=Pseudoalteromonas piscicida TaxID=43662 RepID=A0A2A5JJI6_PSEO7|nr:hypothetical protein CEX98_21905 [Pseudoalteromonas piscicida]
MKLIKLFFLVAAILLLLLGGLSVFSYLVKPDSYKFGTEVGGILYRSSNHYLFFNTSISTLSLFTLVLVVVDKIRQSALFLFLAAILALVSLAY